MIEQPGLSGQLKIRKSKEMTMLKTISAALLATSLIAAPVFAAGAKNTTTPTAQTTQSAADANGDATTGAKSTLKTTAKTSTKSKALNSNARMGKHHKKHISHLRRHKQHNVAALKTRTHAKIQAKAPVKTGAKVSLKQVQPAGKRG
jgi:hypothetical protein